MPTVTLTARNVAKLPAPKSGRIEYFDKKLPGFGLRVTDKGARSWIVLYRHKGTQRRYTIGALSQSLGFGAARDQAKAILRRAANGEDPAADKKREREAETVKELAEQYIEDHAKKHKRSWRADENIINKDLIPRFGNRKPIDITRPDIRGMLKEIEERGSPIQSNRTFEVVRKLFNWAIGEDRAGLEHNPCDHVKKVAKERRRERVLSDDEIRAIWSALPSIDQDSADVYRLLFMTAARKGEVTEMEWPEIDGAWWMLPPERSKNGRPHRVYLTEAARAVLDGRAKPEDRKGRVFPSRGKTGMLFGIYDAHPELLKASGTAGWTLHDIRRTVASNLGKLGFSRFIQDRILNHVDRGVGSIYDVYSYDREREQALTAWVGRLEEIVFGKPQVGNVVTMPAARSA
jgi:integrase